MICKMKSNVSLRDTLNYNIKEYSEISSINNVFGGNWDEIQNQMLKRQKLYEGRAKNLTAHVFLSPSITEGKRLTLLDWKEIANSFLEKARLTNHQSISFLHQDKEHYHLHIVINRIDKEGNLYRHKNELALAQRLGDEIAKERGMIRASQIMRERQLTKEVGSNISEIQGSFENIRKDVCDCARVAFNNEKVFIPEKYFKNLEAKGYKVKVYYKKSSEGTLTNEISGYSIGKKGDRLIKATALGNEFKLERLANNVDDKPEVSIEKVNLMKRVQNSLNESFHETIKSAEGFQIQNYFKALRAKGCAVKEYFTTDTIVLRGYAIEIEGFSFNSSEIGKEYTISNLKKKANQLVSHTEQLTVLNDVGLTGHNNYFPEESNKSYQSTEESISRELIRTIDIVKIETDIKELTSGHRYKSYDEFIRAIEEKGYRVHLRYSLGQLVGYVIHKGSEHYLDDQIGSGKFSLDKLITSKLFRENKMIEVEQPKKSDSSTLGIIANDQISNLEPKQSSKTITSKNNSIDPILKSDNQDKKSRIINNRL